MSTITTLNDGISANSFRTQTNTNFSNLNTTKKEDSMSTNKILGRSTAGTGVVEEITVGSGLSLSAGTLSATGDVAGPASATDNAIARFDTTTGKLIQNSGATIDDSGNITTTNLICTNNAITATGNAATVPVTYKTNTVTNNSAATLTITMTTSGAVNRQIVEVCILDASAVAQTISWVNTENSSITIPTTSNGSTTLPLSVILQYNSATSKWRVLAYS